MSAREPERGYITWRPTKRIRAKLEAVQQVLATYHDYLPMSVRQIFYVLVARLVIQKTKQEYDQLAYLLRKARRARVIPFEHIHDQGSVLPRSLNGWEHASNLAALVRHIVANFNLDPQLGQWRRLVVWCEAAGMLAQLRRVCSPYDIHVITGGGFDSLSDKWRFAQLVLGIEDPVEVLHIGDLDPHGEDIFTALAEDVPAFDCPGVTFTRLAVTPEQVATYNLPTDFEHPNIVQAEALPPDVLADIVETGIRDRLDLDLLAETETRSASIRADFEAKLRAAGLWAAP